jgi:diguanylate cyclase (GGDEF)-like protein
MKTSHQHEEVLHLIVDRVVRLYQCQTCAIVLIDPTTEYLHIDNWHGMSLTFCNQFRQRIATASIGRLLWTGAPVRFTGLESDPAAAEEFRLEHPIVSCACTQIAVDHRTLGYLHVDSTALNAFSDVDVQMLQSFADLAGLAINKSRLYEENLRLERTDRETGLEKYPPFLERLNAVASRAFELGEAYAVLILDVDNFKDTANTFGYDASRELLKQIGQLVKDTLRPIDAAGRYGFDEFIIMLENTDMEGALGYARRLLQEVESRRFTSRGIHSTVSAGVAAYPQNGKTNEELILTAKKGLFEAQRAGRNKVYAYTGEWYSKETEHLEV